MHVQLVRIFYTVALMSVVLPLKGQQAMLSKVENNIIYRSYDNKLAYLVCASCDSIIIQSNAIEIKDHEPENGTLTILPKADKRYGSVSILCQTIDSSYVLLKRHFKFRLLPNPNIYFGGHSLMNDLNRYSDQQFLVNMPLSTRYDSNVTLTAKFDLVYWSVNVGKQEFTGHGRFLSEAFFKAIYKAKKGVRITFNYMLISGPDGNQRKIQLNNTYIKKTKRKTKFPEHDRKRYTEPERGG